MTEGLVLNTSTSFSARIPLGRTLEVFAVGGGVNQTTQPQDPVGSLSKQRFENRTLEVLVTIGEGGSYKNNGYASSVTIGGRQVVLARGGGGEGRPGWSGVHGDNGGTNGQDGTGESLPRMCGDKVLLTPGAAGTDSNGNHAGDGRGAVPQLLLLLPLFPLVHTSCHFACSCSCHLPCSCSFTFSRNPVISWSCMPEVLELPCTCLL